MKPRKKDQPIFFDVTLRDGNQALKRPWNLDQKIEVFTTIAKIGVQGVEAGFASASETDFNSCAAIAKMAPEEMTISSLSRAVKREIEISWEAIKDAGRPRLHIVFPVSPFAIEHIIEKTPDQAAMMVYEALSHARKLASPRPEATIQFSGEHLGECATPEGFDITTPLKIFKAAIRAGADVINLPNTVERFRPSLFTNMVSEINMALKGKVLLSVHNHNDLGMGVATTVESYFAGARQLEVSINGLGERAGNTSLAETAIALKNCGVDVPLNLSALYEVAVKISRLSGVPIHEKMPIVGSDITSHRSGIHQDGIRKSRKRSREIYSPFDFAITGRNSAEQILFTSQSGKSAIMEILESFGIKVNEDTARAIQPVLKEIAEKAPEGELSPATVLEVYTSYRG